MDKSDENNPESSSSTSIANMDGDSNEIDKLIKPLSMTKLESNSESKIDEKSEDKQKEIVENGEVPQNPTTIANNNNNNNNKENDNNNYNNKSSKKRNKNAKQQQSGDNLVSGSDIQSTSTANNNNNSQKDLSGLTQNYNKKLDEFKRAIDLLKLKSATLSGGSSSTQPKTREDALERKFEFWNTQPVPKLVEKDQEQKDDKQEEKNEAIIPPINPEDVSKESLKLPESFIWISLNIDDDDELKELYTLLYENYVEDDDNMFRFNYSPEFLRWVLKSPGWQSEWFVGVRVDKANKKGKLVGFISAIPSKIRVYDKVLDTVEINFLCVHKKLRSKRMAPVLISEITRRVRLHGLSQALYTAGVFLPKPIASCRYYHRSLNPKKLIDVGFCQLTHNMTVSRSIKLYRVPEKPLLQGLRQLEKKDLKQVHQLLSDYMKNFDLVPLFSMEEITHWLLPRPDVVDSYVVERTNENKKKEIIGFFSFYILPSTVMNHKTYKEIRAAYSFYNVPTEHCSLTDLMQDALIIAKNSGLDVFNALNQRDNEQFLEKLKFGCGDGDLHYYLFNWKCPPMKANKVGVVLQ